MSELLYPLAFLACPVGMGVMMWMMRDKTHDSSHTSGAASADEVARLRAEVDQLRAAQRIPTGSGDAVGSD